MDGQASTLDSNEREQGAYIAALMGSKSPPWQQQLSTTSTPLPSVSVATSTPLPSVSQGTATAKLSIPGNAVFTGGSGGGSCFKCGKLGHWARDCDATGGGGGGGGAEREDSDPSVMEKPCPCGLGTCAVFTANTDKNRGRKFYTCPVREKNGGCGFFEWCDKSLGISVSNGSQTKPTNSSFPNLQCPCGTAGGSGSGSCFKCGKLGHWARDCDPLGRGGGGSGGEAEHESSDLSVMGKQCPCGLGTCLVLTANTEKNRGRKFYRCPVQEENGGCGFFEWCDKSLGTPVSNEAQIKPTNSSFPDLQCPCGAGSCFVLTAKTGRNVGHQFYRCPSNQGCGFFKWCIEHNPAAGLSMSYSGRVSSSCFKCGQEGHWAKDCPKPSSDPSAEGGARSGGRSSSSCFKCGQEGHWARDCTKPSYDSPTKVVARSGSSGTCYRCSKPGHWARDCPA